VLLENPPAIVDRYVDQMVVVLALTGPNTNELVVCEVPFSVAVELIDAFTGLSSVMQLELVVFMTEFAASMVLLFDPFEVTALLDIVAGKVV